MKKVTSDQVEGWFTNGWLVFLYALPFLALAVGAGNYWGQQTVRKELAADFAHAAFLEKKAAGQIEMLILQNEREIAVRRLKESDDALRAAELRRMNDQQLQKLAN